MHTTSLKYILTYYYNLFAESCFCEKKNVYM